MNHEPTTRDRILSILSRQYPDELTTADLNIMLDRRVTKQRLSNILSDLVKARAIERVSRSVYRYVKETPF